MFGFSLKLIKAVLEEAQTPNPVNKGCLGEQVFLFSLDSSFLIDRAASAVPWAQAQFTQRSPPASPWQLPFHQAPWKLSKTVLCPAEPCTLGRSPSLCFFQLVGGETQLKPQGELPPGLVSPSE